MGNLPNTVTLEIEDVSPVRGTTAPRLEVQVAAKSSHHNVQVKQVDSELKFSFPQNQKSIDGPIPNIPTARFSEINLNGTNFTINIEFDRRSLDVIEEHRAGGDIELTLRVWIIGERNDQREEGTFNLTEELIDAQWNRILEALDYHDKRAVGLNLGVSNTHLQDRLETVHSKIENAQRKHDTGDYPAAVTECRRAIEALQTIEELENAVDKRKREDIETIMSNFEKGFAGGLSHAEEMTDITPALSRDSEFALNLTKACVRYVTTAIQESESPPP